ncbi:MAG: amidohydrolase family protein [Bacteroidia bacterium]|nr:amidohydrolase family protein [Bacteroidia bacterium]
MNQICTSLALLFLCLRLPAQEANSPQNLLIREVNVVVLASESILEGQDVLIEEGVIRHIAPSIPLTEEQQAYLQVDGKDLYLTAGWIDAHIHFFQSGGIYTRPDALDLRAIKPYEQERYETRALAEDFMRRYLAAGVTSICDVGGPMENYQIREKSRSVMAPEVYVTGPLISTYVPKELEVDDPPIIKASSAEDAKAMVQAQLISKPDFIKIWFIVFPGESPEDSRRLVEAAIAESHLHGIPVAVHATQLETARLAVELGADILVHSVSDKEVDDRFIALLLERNVSYIPTLQVSENYDLAFKNKLPFTEADFLLANPFTLGSLMDLRHLPAGQLPAWLSRFRAMPDNSSKTNEIMFNNLKRISDAGVNVVTGTDAGNIGTLHASSYFAEWSMMTEAGLSPAQILRASTLHGATMLGLQATSGAVASGMRADLVLLTHNPLDSLPGASDIRYVVKGGNLLSPGSLISSDPESMAQRQLNAYNARNLEAFVACYSEEVEVYQFPDQLQGKGRAYLREGYGPMFENTPGLHCELVNRITVGNKVIDQEKVRRFGEGRILDAVAIYEVKQGLISKVYFIVE